MKVLFNIAILCFLDLFRSRAALQLEILALRHQLAVFQRTKPSRLNLHPLDLLLWWWLSRIRQG
ncbi:MAG: hypothetical protein HQL80_13360 [Magnetococcales bacterium]|nr:hypothetical protein [Magnetococcales bacterium]